VNTLIGLSALRRQLRLFFDEFVRLFETACAHAEAAVAGDARTARLDIMVDLLLVRRLQPWAANAKKRLVRTPKVYVRDTGLLHALLGIRNQEELLGHPVVGSSWERAANRKHPQLVAIHSEAYLLSNFRRGGDRPRD
jgi:hypothetical protein